MNIVKIEAQHDFPDKDVTDSNAEILDLLMLNWDIIKKSHTSAEAAHYLYRLGHKSLVAAVTPQINNPNHIEAFSHGIAVYEAVAAMARPKAYPESDAGVSLEVISMQHALMHDHDLTGTLTNAHEQFQDEQPRLARVIGDSAARFCQGGTAVYAKTGAAIARQLEINTRRK